MTKSGNLRLELGFEVALSITGNILVYSMFDNVIKIDKDRQVTQNYRIEPLNMFIILAILDVPVSQADQVRRYNNISTNPARIQDNGLCERRVLFL